MVNTDNLAYMARVVRGAEPYRSPQGTVYSPGINAQTADSRVLFLGLVTLLPGERIKAHVHERHESAFYLLSGKGVELWSGDQLQDSRTARAGDYLFIPAGVPHVAVNRGKDAAVFVGARNDPTASESSTMLPELDRNVP